MALRLLEAGLCTLVVDFGRPGFRSLGVPLGGAADRTALVLGNALLGNPPHAAALEISLAGPTLRADCPLACVLYGAPFSLASDRQRLTAGTTFTLYPDEDLCIGSTPEGMRAYFCVQGGLRAQRALGSYSSLEPLRAGAELGCVSGRIRPRFVRPIFSEPSQPRTIRVLNGSQADWFANEQFYGREYTVTPTSNRMGLRLEGEPLRGRQQKHLVSEPVCPGTVQVTQDGQCIILGMDSQTIGGYPKIAQVISADLDKLGQLRPGDQISFARVSLDEAEQIYRKKRAELFEWMIRLQSTLGI